MTEFYQPELKVSALRERVRAAERFPASGAESVNATRAANLLPDLALQPPFIPRERNAGYQASELLQFHDEAFIKHAYRALLGREPDAGGGGYLAALRSGRINRLDVLAQLRFSAEGVKRGVPLAGVRGPAVLRRAYRVPFVGPALRWAVSLARLPRLVRHVNQLESHLVAQQEQIVAYVNELNRLNNEQQAGNAKRLDGLATQQHELEHWHKAATATYAEMAQVSLAQMAEELNGALSRLSAAQQESAEILQQQLSVQGTELAQQRDELAAQGQAQGEAVQKLQRQMAAQETASKRQHDELIAQAQAQKASAAAQFNQLAQRLEAQKAALSEQLTKGQTSLTQEFTVYRQENAQQFAAYRQEAAQQFAAQQAEVERLAAALAQARASVREELQAQIVAATQTLAAQLQKTTREETKAREQFAQNEMAARENFVKAEMTARELFVQTEMAAREAFLQAEADARTRLAEDVAGITAHLAAQQENQDAQNQALAAWQQEVATRVAVLEMARAEAQERLARDLRAEALRADAQAQAIRAELVLQSGRVERLFKLAQQRLPNAPFTPAETTQLAAEAQHSLDAFYVALEDRLRGSRETILERLGVYLPFLRENGLGGAKRPVLDLGCGRGEWLELLRQEGFTASGVDTNSVLTAQCHALNLQVAEADILAHLRDLPDESQGVVTCFHVVEHLPLESVLELLNEALRVLQPGGLAIFETPNPRNVLVGSCNFYYDPTHRNPVPSPVLQFMLEARGFARVEVLNLNPSDAQPVSGDEDITRRFNDYFYGPMDYAAVGWKI